MDPTAHSRPRYSIVVPVFNEQAVLPVLLHRLDLMMQDIDGVAETIFVDDGSSDCSAIILRAKAKDDPRYRFIGLSRNFGHQAAITAGMAVASGDAVIVMDADLQDPPEVVGQMIEKWKEGYEVVYGRRLSREGDSAFKQATAGLFYKLLGRLSSVDIPRDAGDFRLIDRKVLEAFLAMPEQDRFVRGMFAWLGLPANRSGLSSPVTTRRRDEVSVVENAAAGVTRRRRLFRRTAAAGDLVRFCSFGFCGALRAMGGRPLVGG